MSDDLSGLGDVVWQDALQYMIQEGERSLADQLVDIAREQGFATVDDIDASFVIQDETGKQYPLDEGRVRRMANETLAAS